MRFSGFLAPRRIIYGFVAVFSLLICGLPLVNLARLGLQNFSFDFFLDSGWQKVLHTTLIFAGLSTFFSLIVGTLTAYFVTRTDLPGSSWLKSLLLAPYIIPTCLSAIAWTVLGNPAVGWLKVMIPGINIYTLSGVVFVETLYWYTFVFLTVGTALSALNTSLEESARMCGATPWQVFRFVTLPLLKPALLGSALIVFPCVVSSFGIPAIVGAPGKIQVLTTKLYQLVKIGTPQAILSAMVVSLPVVAGAFVLLTTAETRFGRTAYSTLSGKATRTHGLKLKKWRWPAFALVAGLGGIAVILPIGTLVVTSFIRSFGDMSFSLQNYVAVLSSPETLASLSHSGFLAVVGAALLTSLAFFLSYFKTKTRFLGKDFLTSFVSLPYAAPGTILALALLFTLTGYSTWTVLLMAYVAKHLSHAIKIMTPALINVHGSLEEASSMCGANWLVTVRRIWLPILKTTFSSCFFLMLAPLFSELTMSVLIASSDYPTVGTRLFHLQEYESPNQAAVLAVIVLVLVLGLNAVVKRLSGGRLGV